MNKRKTVIVFTSIIAGIILVFAAYLSMKYKTTTTTDNTTGRVTYVGQLETVDVSGMATDAPGVFKVRSGNNLVTVNLNAGVLACDRTAITVPNAKVGDRVSISGDRGSDGVVRVCSQGTYIKTTN